MKKFIAIFTIMLLVLTGTFTGCSSKKSLETSKTDKTWDTSSTEKTDWNAASEESDVQPNISYDYDMQEEVTEESKDSSVAGAATTESIYSSEITDSYKMTQDVRNDSVYEYGGLNDLIVPNQEEYIESVETGYNDARVSPLSTFSIDVDTASYTNLRKKIKEGYIPQSNSVRIEEMLNYFDYDYEEPTGEKPFSIHTEIGKCPWNEEHYLLTVGLQGKNMETDRLPKTNLVFLIDVSGSMDEPDKLPLLKNAFSKLVNILGERDRVSIVVYAGDSGIVLGSVPGNEKERLISAIESLNPSGSTGGAAGINLAYQLAEKNYIKDGNNRIILATDGDFNVGPSSVEELEALITEKRESGIFLSVLGFGSGNLKDNKMETLADKGNGNYSYIDSTKEAKKVLVDEMAGTLLAIAKDVKIQVEFNPYNVAAYRLIGYENRALANEDFKNDTVDAGELGAGHRVTAVYEILPRVATSDTSSDLKYQTGDTLQKEEYSYEICEIRLRYKEVDENESQEIKQVVTFDNTPVKQEKQSSDFYFAAAVIEFGMLLRESEHRGNTSIDSILDLAEKGLAEDENGYRLEFMDLVDQYEELLRYSW